jgi:hypothetical protein
MSALQNSELPELKRHTIGIFDRPEACVQALRALNEAGFPDADTYVFYGAEGIQALQEVLNVNLWGESSEHLAKQCLSELEAGHAVMSVKTETDEEASTVAAVASQFGGRNIYHFGLLVDTRLTS